MARAEKKNKRPKYDDQEKTTATAFIPVWQDDIIRQMADDNGITYSYQLRLIIDTYFSAFKGGK